MIAEGLIHRQIAEKLAISRRTVDGHVERLLRTLGMGSRPRIATWVVEQRP